MQNLNMCMCAEALTIVLYLRCEMQSQHLQSISVLPGAVLSSSYIKHSMYTDSFTQTKRSDLILKVCYVFVSAFSKSLF